MQRGIRQASRKVVLPQRLCRSSALRAVGTWSTSAPRTTPAIFCHTRKTFSTMASLQSAAAPSPSEGKGYDPEIKDIADYVHNKPINSDLAVSFTFAGAPPKFPFDLPPITD